MQKNYNENLVAGAAIRDDKGRRISKLFESPHPKMTVGYAKNLIMPNDPTEQEFNFRQSGGGVIEDGVAVIDKVKGKSVVWNQKLPLSILRHGDTISGVTIVKNDDGSYTCNGTAAEGFYFSMMESNTIAPTGHRIAIKGCPAGGSDASFYMNDGWGTNSNDYGAGAVYIINSNGYISIRINIIAGYTCNNLTFRPRIYDLTQMFGAGNEPSTYEEFLSRKPKVADEYAYNEGGIINNKVEKVVTTGRNLCPYLEQGTLSISDGSEQPSETRVRTPFIPISNKHSYSTMLNKWSIRNGCFYDRNKNFISSGYPSTSTGILDSSNIPANAAFYRLIYSAQNGTDVVTPSYDVFMFAIGNTTIPTTKYESYEEHELDLSWVKDIKDAEGMKLFEDGLKSAGTVFDEVAKGKAIKRIGVVDLGSLDWTKYTGANHELFQTIGLVGLILASSSKKVANVTCNKYNAISVNDLYSHKVDGVGVNENGTIDIYDKALIGETAEDFKTVMQGVELYYELAEPIEVEYDEKNLTYPVVAGGTEEAIASEPSSAFRADIGYGIDAVKTILDLKARVEALEKK